MYWALIEDMFWFHEDKANATATRRRDLYKRLELALRAHGPRFSTMRRSTPAEYAVWIKEIEDFARKGRTEALNSFYGHTVLREARRNQRKPGNETNRSWTTRSKKTMKARASTSVVGSRSGLLLFPSRPTLFRLEST